MLEHCHLGISPSQCPKGQQYLTNTLPRLMTTPSAIKTLSFPSKYIEGFSRWTNQRFGSEDLPTYLPTYLVGSHECGKFENVLNDKVISDFNSFKMQL